MLNKVTSLLCKHGEMTSASISVYESAWICCTEAHEAAALLLKHIPSVCFCWVTQGCQNCKWVCFRCVGLKCACVFVCGCVRLCVSSGISHLCDIVGKPGCYRNWGSVPTGIQSQGCETVGQKKNKKQTVENFDPLGWMVHTDTRPWMTLRTLYSERFTFYVIIGEVHYFVEFNLITQHETKLCHFSFTYHMRNVHKHTHLNFLS